MMLNMTAFRYTASCSLVEFDRRFKREYCLHHQSDEYPWWWRKYAPLKRRSISHNAVIFILAVVRTWNFTKLMVSSKQSPPVGTTCLQQLPSLGTASDCDDPLVLHTISTTCSSVGNASSCSVRTSVNTNYICLKHFSPSNKDRRRI
jgi:hypothetical protein